ncbi:hypothetical protein AVEN_32468-1 [Araneus ventricosus]|uniref:Uncharacterized protein n=1 Tax=Araneus ventricosus TaxID=182803 RepID=A0A4Y2ET52_ARAVE|nr:hypothetical protein AVEN_32468-1 [Araneus ventricosus]
MCRLSAVLLASENRYPRNGPIFPSNQVLSWLCRKGNESLERHQAIADSLGAIKQQEEEFEKFYFLAMQPLSTRQLGEQSSLGGETVAVTDSQFAAASSASSIVHRSIFTTVSTGPQYSTYYKIISLIPQSLSHY